MTPPINEIIKLIQTGSLLPHSLFSCLDCDAILDARDSDPEFEQTWLATRESLRNRFESLSPSPQVRADVENLRRESFLAVSNSTHQHELSSYVSDDFELIAWASAVGDTPPFITWLWKSYEAGKIPSPG
jgi:hypothetical protein